MADRAHARIQPRARDLAAMPHAQTEILTALAGLSSSSTRVVIAGDPQQLGPIVRSAVGALGRAAAACGAGADRPGPQHVRMA